MSTPSWDFKDEKQVEQYINNIEIEYSFHCFGEKSPDGCHRLAQFYETLRIDKDKAFKLYRKACDEYNYGISCNRLAKHMMRKALPATTDEIFHYHEKACENGFSESCYSAALMHMDKDYVGTNTNLEKCLKLFNKGCDQNDARNCSKLGEIYRKGSHVEKDMIKSMNYHKKGCELQSVRSCYNLSIMFRNGDGVEKNEKLAEEYSNIAKKLYDDQCQASNLKMSQDVQE